MPTTADKIASIQVIGRRWFQRSYGNTYNTADIYINGEHVHTLPTEYGYGDHYMTRAQDWLEANGYIKLERYELFREYCERNGIIFMKSVTDVSRERDL
jgi:hypothetical protein